MECISGEGTGPGVKSRCWNGIPDEELEELLPRKMANLQPKSSGSLRRRLLSAKLHQNCNAVRRMNMGSTNTCHKAACSGDDRKPLLSQHHHSANTGSLWQRTQHLPSRPHIYPSCGPETLGKPFLAPEFDEKPFPSQSLQIQLQRSAHHVITQGCATNSNSSQTETCPVLPLKGPERPQYQKQSSRRYRFSIKKWRKRRNARQEVTQTTPLLPKAAGDSKWSVHFTTQKQHQDLVFVPAKRRSGSAEDLSVCSLLTQEHVSVEAHLHHPGSTHLPSSYGLLDHSEGTSSKGSWKNRSRKMKSRLLDLLSQSCFSVCFKFSVSRRKSSTSSHNDEHFFLNHIRPMTPLVLNPVQLHSTLDGFSSVEELADNIEVEPNSRLPTPEERMRWQSEAVPSDIVAINITGETFDRQASFKRTLSNVDSLSCNPSKLSCDKTGIKISESINRKSDSSLGDPGLLSEVVPPISSGPSLDQHKEEKKTEIIKQKQLSNRKIQAPKQEVISCSKNPHSLHLSLSTRVLPQPISSSSSLPCTPCHRLGPERSLSLTSCSLSSIPVLESQFYHQSFNGLTPFYQHQDNADGLSYRPFSQSSSVQSGWTRQKCEEDYKPLLSSGRSSPSYPDTASLYSDCTTSSQSLHQLSTKRMSSSHTYTGRISLRKSKRPPPPPLRSDSLRRRPGCSKSSLPSTSTSQETKISQHIFCDPWVPRGNSKKHQTCNTNVAFEPLHLEARLTNESSSSLCHALLGSTALELEMLTFTYTSSSNSSGLQCLASPSSGYSSDSNTPINGTPLSSPLIAPFPTTPTSGVFSHPQPPPLNSLDISNPPLSLPVTLLQRKSSWTEGKQKPPVPERKSSLVSSNSSTSSLSCDIIPEPSCKGTSLLLQLTPACSPIPGSISSEKSVNPCTYTEAPPGPPNPSCLNDQPVASTSISFSHLSSLLASSQTSCISPSVKPCLAAPAPPPPLPSSWQLTSASCGQLDGAQSLALCSHSPTTTIPPTEKNSDTSFQPSPSLSYSNKHLSSVAPTCSTSMEELSAAHQTPIYHSRLPEPSSLSSAEPLHPPPPQPPPLPPLLLPMPCPSSSAKVHVSLPAPPPLPNQISTTPTISTTPCPPAQSSPSLSHHMSPISSFELSGNLSPEHLSKSAQSSSYSSPPCPTEPLSHCSTKTSDLPLHPFLHLSFTAPPPPSLLLPFYFRPSPPPYAYAVRQSSQHSIISEQSSSSPQTSSLLSSLPLPSSSLLSSLSSEDHGELKKTVLSKGQPHCTSVPSQALQDTEVPSVNNQKGSAMVQSDTPRTKNAYLYQPISDDKIKGPQTINCVSKDMNPNNIKGNDSFLVSVKTIHEADVDSPCSAGNRSIALVHTTHDSEKDIKLYGEKPQNPKEFCLATSLDYIDPASDQKAFQGKEKDPVAILKENPREATIHPDNHRSPEKPVLPKRPDLCILGVNSSPKVKVEPREKSPTEQATVSCLQTTQLHSTKQTFGKTPSLHSTDNSCGSLVGSIKREKLSVLQKELNLNSLISEEFFRHENILDASEKTFMTKAEKNKCTVEDYCASESLNTFIRSSCNINAESRPWKSMENLSTKMNSANHDCDTQITETGQCRTWKRQKTSLLNCDPNTIKETMFTEPLENLSILGNMKAPGSSTANNYGSINIDKEDKIIEKRQTPMMITMNSSEKKKARKKRKMRVKRQLLMMSSTFEAIPSSFSSSSEEEHDVIKSGSDQAEGNRNTFTPSGSCTGQNQSCLSNALSTDSFSEDLSIPDLLIYEEEPEEEKREFGGHPDENQFVSISADQMFDSGKPRTTEDLFVAIYRSKRRMLGRGDSFSSCSSITSSFSSSIQNVSTPLFQDLVPKKSMTSASFKALLLRKGSRSDISSRISAVERLCKAAPYTNANNEKKCTPFLLDPQQSFQEELLISSFTLNKFNSALKTPVSAISPRFSWTLGQRYLKKTSSLSSPFIFLSSSGRPRSLTPPCSSSRHFAARCRLHAAPMTAIFEGKNEEEEEEGFINTENCD